MIQKNIALNKIKYQKMKINDDLIDSISKRGIAIAIKVKQIDEDLYECIDGHKRLNALAILAIDNPKYNLVPCVLQNDFSKAGSAYWGNTKNRH